MENSRHGWSASYRITLVFIALLAAGLRLWGLIFGPPLPHPDELLMVIFPLNFFSGDLNPHHFHYPTLHYYLLGLVYGLCFLSQKIFGAGWSASEFVAYHYFWNPESLLVWARLVSVVFAVGTVWWTACLAKRLYGAGPGLVAGLLMALGVVHVRQTLLAGVDSALAFWCVGVVWATVRLLDHEKPRDYVMAGVLLGLAAGTKYPAAVLGLVILAVHLLGRRSLFDRRLWLAALASICTFVMASPYVLLDSQTFQGDFLYEMEHAQKGRDGAGGFAYQVVFTLRHNLGWPALLLMVSGVVMAIRQRLRAAEIVSISFLIYYIAISWGNLAFTRYALPLLPFQAVLVAGGIRILPRLRWQMALAMALAVEPLYGSIRVDQILAATDTRAIAKNWIESNVPAGSLCCNFGGWTGDVPVQTFESHWWRLQEFAGIFGEDTILPLLKFLEKTKPPVPFYSYAVQNGKEVGSGSMAAVESVQCPYILLHRHPLAYSRIDPGFSALLEKRGQRIALWTPEGLHESFPQYDPIDAYYVPLGEFGTVKQPGPEIEVWRMAEYPIPEQKVQTTRDVFAMAYMVWAAHVHKQSDDEGARHYLSQALAVEPNDAGVYISIGNEYRKLHEPQKSIETWGKVLAREPDNKAALFNTALVYQIDMNHPRESIPYWQRAIQAGIDMPDAYIHLANAYLFLRQEGDAKQWFRKAIERYPNLPQGQQIRQILWAR